MENYVSDDPINWLLEEDNPSIRYFTIKDIFDIHETDAELQNVKQSIMDNCIVKEILQIQKEDSYIEAYPNFYTTKYKGLVWQMIILAELGAGENLHIKQQCEYILENSKETRDGGFAMHRSAKMGGGRITEVIPCLTGNMIWTLIHFGYLEEIRVKKAIEWVTKYMRFNDGKEEYTQVYPYNRMDDAFDILLSKQTKSGRWKIEKTYKENQFLVPMEKKSEDSKWLTLRALRVIKRY